MGYFTKVSKLLKQKRIELLEASERVKNQIPNNPEARKRLEKIQKELRGE
jgi:hypothetical protein